MLSQDEMEDGNLPQTPDPVCAGWWEEDMQAVQRAHTQTRHHGEWITQVRQRRACCSSRQDRDPNPPPWWGRQGMKKSGQRHGE